MLFLGIFSFVAGIIGFYGAKYMSKEYLKTVLFLLFPVSFLNLFFMIFFINDYQRIKDEQLLTPTATEVLTIFNISDFVFKVAAIIVLMYSIKRLRDMEIQTTTLSKVIR